MKKLISFFVTVLSLMYCAHSWSCTGITLNTLNHAYITGRTLEFYNNLDTQLIVVPREMSFQGYTSEDKRNGITWKVKYAYAGFNFYHQKYVFEGVNEKGMYAGDYLFLTAKYKKYSPAERESSLASWQLVSYILSNFSDVGEVKKHLPDLTVLAIEYKRPRIFFPLHTKVTDKSGKSIVIEYIDGKLKIYDDPLGIITNAPSFDWQITNLTNYPNLTNSSIVKVKMSDQTLDTFGVGYGLKGLPGDYSSPSRFIRAAFFTRYAKKIKSPVQTVSYAFHILNAFDIPYGTVKEPAFIGADKYAYTSLTDVIDLQNLNIYFKTYKNQNIKMLNLNSEDLTAGKIQVINLAGKTQIENISNNVS